MSVDIYAKLAANRVIDTSAADTLNRAIAQGKSFDDAVCVLGPTAEERILRFLAEDLCIPFVDLAQEPAKHAPSRDTLAKFPRQILLKYRLVPLESEHAPTPIATSRVFDTEGLDLLRLATGLDIYPVIATSGGGKGEKEVEKGRRWKRGEVHIAFT